MLPADPSHRGGLAVALALGAALLFALGTVLQQRVAAAEPQDGGSAPLLLRLARRPLWLAGVGADGLGFVAQAAALGAGRLSVVQPLLAASLVFALPLAAALEHRRVGRRRMLAAVAVTGGLGLFLVLADPSGGHDDASPVVWSIAGAACAAAALAGWALARHAAPVARAALLGAATGVLFGLSAALTKATVERLDGGVLHVALDWHVWALVAVGYASMALAQASLQAGPLGPAVATQMALDPIASLLLGTLAFGERLHADAAGTAGALAGIALMVAGIAALATAHAPWPGVRREPISGTRKKPSTLA
jgi:drug/metabolite transporter (DMT)-like permease